MGEEISEELVVIDGNAKEVERYLIDGVPVSTTPCTSNLDAAILSGNASTMSFNLQSAGLAVQIQSTTPVNLQIADLQSKLELVLLKLSETEQRLDAAMRRIGFLEAQLTFKADEVADLQNKLLSTQP